MLTFQVRPPAIKMLLNSLCKRNYNWTRPGTISYLSLPFALAKIFLDLLGVADVDYAAWNAVYLEDRSEGIMQ
jgi:hypothetical protein